MLPSPNRLRRPVDVERVQRLGRGWRHPLAILLVRSNELEASRFTFIASRHVGTAVKRNRAKRLLREAVRIHLSEIVPGKDCILIVRPPLVSANFQEAEAAVLQLLRRAKLLDKSEVNHPNR